MLSNRLAPFISKCCISSLRTSSPSSFFSSLPPIQPWLFIGLGNPGEKYQSTRHNVRYAPHLVFQNFSGSRHWFWGFIAICFLLGGVWYDRCICTVSGYTADYTLLQSTIWWRFGSFFARNATSCILWCMFLILSSRVKWICCSHHWCRYGWWGTCSSCQASDLYESQWRICKQHFWESFLVLLLFTFLLLHDLFLPLIFELLGLYFGWRN